MIASISFTRSAVAALAAVFALSMTLSSPAAMAAMGPQDEEVKEKPKELRDFAQQQRKQAQEQRGRAVREEAAKQKTEMLQRTFALAPEKAEAVFNILAPNHVKVRVGRTKDGVAVTGTRIEVNALQQFCELLTRNMGTPPEAVLAMVENGMKEWPGPKTFKLKERDAKLLYAALAADDVPVLVEGALNGILVHGSAEDLRTLNKVARILQGERLSPKQKDAKAPKARKPKRQRPKKPAVPQAPEPLAPSREHAQGIERHIQEMHELFQLRMEEVDQRTERLHREMEHIHRQLTEEVERLRQEMHELHAHHQADMAREQHHHQQPDPDVLTVRSYVLPPHHAEHVFALLAPDDVRDVVVSRSGDKITVRANEHDHATIERMIDLLIRQ